MDRGLKKSERLRTVETALVNAAPHGVTMSELAERFSVYRSTILRDLRTLEENNIPIQQEDSRFWIDPMDYVSSVRLTVGESLMLYLAIRRTTRQMSHIPQIMMTAMEKMTSALRHPTNTQLVQVTQSLYEDRIGTDERARVWETLVRAWVEGITIRFTYQKYQQAETKTYEFQPYLFEPAILSEGVYMVGHCLNYDELRTFKVERILKASLTTLTFEPKMLDANQLMRYAWGIWFNDDDKPLIEVVLRFSPEVARRVKETIWHPTQEITDRDDGGVEWRVRVGGTQELIPWVRGWGSAVEVIAPTDLRRLIADDLRHAAERYFSK